MELYCKNENICLMTKCESGEAWRELPLEWTQPGSVPGPVPIGLLIAHAV